MTSDMERDCREYERQDAATRLMAGLLREGETVATEALKYFEFKVRFRNDRMGFTRVFSTEAQNATQAIEFAYALLVSQNYKRVDFAAAEVIRGREVGT